jgi:hypothetical protein
MEVIWVEEVCCSANECLVQNVSKDNCYEKQQYNQPLPSPATETRGGMGGIRETMQCRFQSPNFQNVS